MSRLIKTFFAAASTWLSGWVLSAACWFLWVYLILGLDIITLQEFHLSNNYQPTLWAGYPGLGMGYGLAIWLVLKSKVKNRATSFKALGTFVLLAQSICYAPCLMPAENAMFLTEFLLFPLLCAGYAGLAVYRSLGSPSNPGTPHEIHPA